MIRTKTIGYEKIKLWFDIKKLSWRIVYSLYISRSLNDNGYLSSLYTVL